LCISALNYDIWWHQIYQFFRESIDHNMSIVRLNLGPSHDLERPVRPAPARNRHCGPVASCQLLYQLDAQHVSSVQSSSSVVVSIPVTWLSTHDWHESSICADAQKQTLKANYCSVYACEVWLISGVVSTLDSGTEGPGFKSQSRRCRVTVLGKLFMPIVPLFTKQQNW